MDNSRINYIQSAVNDVQATIRAIDVKVGALLVLVLAPFSSLSRVFAHVDNLCCRSPKWVFIAIGVAFFTAWFLALASLVRAIGAMGNPATHISGNSNVKGTYYGGGLYNFGIFDTLINRKKIIAKKDLVTFVNDLPSLEEDIVRELAFEQMKVVYIRDIKANRLKWGVRFCVVWLMLGSTIFLTSRYAMAFSLSLRTSQPSAAAGLRYAPPLRLTTDEQRHKKAEKN